LDEDDGVAEAVRTMAMQLDYHDSSSVSKGDWCDEEGKRNLQESYKYGQYERGVMYSAVFARKKCSYVVLKAHVVETYGNHACTARRNKYETVHVLYWLAERTSATIFVTLMAIVLSRAMPILMQAWKDDFMYEPTYLKRRRIC
jgi:hypothetical protein